MEDKAFFFLRSSSAFLLASSSSLRAFSSCKVWHTEANYSRRDSQLPQQPVSLQGMWSGKCVDENWQLLFPVLALRGWSFLLQTERGRTCSFFLSLEIASNMMLRQGQRCKDTYRKPCLTLLLLLSPDSLLLCSFSSALLLQEEAVVEALSHYCGFTYL